VLALLSGLGACTSGSIDTDKDTTDSVDTEPVATLSPPVVSVGPAEPRTLDDLVAVVTPADTAHTLTFAWSVDGTARPDLTTDTVPAAETSKGESWTVSVTASDGESESDPGTASVIVLNTPPEASLTLLPASPSSLDPLSAEVTTSDADGDPVTVDYSWEINDQTTTITTPTVPVGSTETGQTWKVTATPNDGAEDGAAVEASVRVGNAAPFITAAAVNPTSPRSNGTLTATQSATDADGDRLTFSYVWFVNGNEVLGQNASTINGDHFTRDDVVTFTVTAFDGQDHSAPFPATNSATVINTAPNFTTVTLSATTATEASVLSCAASGWTDLDGDPEGYLWSWYINGNLQPGLNDPTLTGASFDRGQQVSCGAQAWDGDAGSAVLISAPATILNTPPAAGGVRVSNLAPQTDAILVATPHDIVDPDGDDVTFTFAWYVSGSVRGTSNTLQSDQFAAGDTFYVEATPHDGLVAGTTVRSATGAVANTPPVVNLVTVTPGAPQTGDSLVAFATASDLDGHQVTYSYAWFINGNTVAGATTNRLDASRTARGNNVMAQVIAHDGFSPSAPAYSTPVVVLNTPPELASVSLGPSGATVATPLVCAPGAWSDDDNDPPGYRYAWTVGGQTLSGATSATLTTGFVRGNSVRCVVTPDDGRDPGDAVQSNAVSIVNAAPTLASVSLSTTTPSTHTTIGIVPNGAYDADNDTITYRYQWYVDGAPAGTGATLPGTAFQQRQQIYVDVTPFDGLTLGATVRSNTATVINGPPAITSVLLAPSPANTTQDLICSWTGSDVDSDPLTPTYFWRYNGTLLTDVTGNTLPAARTTKGDSVRCDVSITDGYDVAGPTSSATLVITNSAPTLAAATIAPRPAYEGSVLSCTPSGWFDADGDTPGYAYRWRRNGDVVGTTTTLASTVFNRGDSITCGITPNDGDAGGRGIEVNSAALVISNTAPQLGSATLTMTSPRVTDSVGVTYAGATDIDNDQLSPLYAWYVEGHLVSTSPTLSGALFYKGDQIQAEVRVTDGVDASAPVWSNVAVAINTPPEVTQVQFSPNQPTAVDSLTVVAFYDDPDGDGVVYTYTWLVDDVEVQTGANPTLHHSAYDSGDLVRVRVLPFDGEEYGPAFLSEPILINNTPPTVEGTVLSITNIYETSTVSCEPYGWFDEDGDAEGYHWEWWVDDRMVSASQTITGSRFDKHDDIYCVAIPFDGTSEGDPVSSEEVEVLNSPPTAVSATLSRLQPAEGQTINVLVQSPLDADGDAVQYSYRWFVQGAQVSTAASLTSALFDKHDLIYAEVDVSDGEDHITLTSNTVTAVNTTPRVTSVVLAPAEPRTNDTITATVTATDADGDAITLSYVWTVAGVPVTGVNAASLPGSYFSKNELVFVTVTGTDDEASGPSTNSNPVRVVNTPPALAGISVTPSVIYESSAVTCSGTGGTDADNDGVSVRYSWHVNGVERVASNNLSNAFYTRDDVLQCFATPFDGEDEGTMLVSAQYTVQNSPPVIASVVLSNNNPTEGSLVIATAVGVADADNDLVELAYRWEVNGVTASTANAIDSTRFNRGDTLRAFITPYDGFVNGAATASLLVTVGNSAPYLTGAPQISPTTAYTTSNLTATATGLDADAGDVVTLTYTWTINNVPVQTGSSATLASSFTASEQQVRVQVTPHDGTIAGDMRESSARRINNTQPQPPTVALNTATPRPGIDNLVCSITAPGYDPDVGDSQVYQFQFSRGAIDWPFTATTPTSATVSASTIQAGYVWTCQARVFDGTINSFWSTGAVATTATFDPASCADHVVYGAHTDGVYTLHPPQEKPYQAWCDQSTDGGGWTRVARTTGAELDVGQAGWSIVDTFADVLDEEGAFEAFAAVRDVRELMLVQTEGAQAGAYAVYDLFRPPTGWTLLEILESCRDEAPAPGLDGVFAAPGVLGHTSWYSGTLRQGDLRVHDSASGDGVPPSYVHLCGVHEAGANAVSYLAFTDQRGDGPGWSTPWWGPGQPGTLWSFASGPYQTAGATHIGGAGMLGFAGWKAADEEAAIWHEGSYELYVR
jgi:hypothetical protein